MTPQYKEAIQNRNISHSVVMREYGTSRCFNHLSSEFRVAAEEQLIIKKLKETKCDLPDYTRSTYLMVFSPDGKKMASSHGNHNVYVTDVKTGKNLNTLTGHPRTPWCIAFHPSSNQILASGCLGGQVRVWDLHGGSEVWTVEGQTSIASLAFHPSDRLLIIASYNEIHFWDWSQPEPFARCSTLNEKEKIRYVAFDYTGSKLITGIEIPKPLVSQWDRVGPGGHASRSAGPRGPRPSGQRPGFGPVFSRPSQGPGPGPPGPPSGPRSRPPSRPPSSPVLRLPPRSPSSSASSSSQSSPAGSTPSSTSGPPSGSFLDPTSGPSNLFSELPAAPGLRAPLCFGALHRAASNTRLATRSLEGRVRQQVQLLQLFLDARNRQTGHNIPARRSPVNNERSSSTTAETSYVGDSSSHVNPSESHVDPENTASANASQDQNEPSLPETFQELRNLHQQSNLSHTAIESSSRISNGGRTVVVTNAATSHSPQQPSTDNESLRNQNNGASIDNTTVNGASSASHFAERLMDLSVESSSERRNAGQHRNFPNFGASSGFRRGGSDARGSVRSAGLGSQRQPTSVISDSDMTNRIHHLSEDIRGTLYTLSDHVDSLQHCSNCMPRMSNSRLSHIQQLWAELREQIRSLQSNIWENTTLASNAWHRSCFEVITEMLSQLIQGTQGECSVQRRESTNTRLTSTTQSGSHRISSLSASSSNARFSEGSPVRPVALSNNSRVISSPSSEDVQSYSISLSRGEEPLSLSTTSSNLLHATSSATSSNSSSCARTSPRSSLRGLNHRSLHRPNLARRLLYLRSQNAQGRRLGSTAGALRSHRISLSRSSLPNQEPQQDSSSTYTGLFSNGDHMTQEPLNGVEPEETRLPTIDHNSNRGGHAPVHSWNNEIPERLSDNFSHSSTSSPGRDAVENVGSAQSQLAKYRLFLGRRRNSASRPTRCSRIRGISRPPRRSTPPRYFGGRRSVFEVAVDPATLGHQEQPSRISRSSNQSSVRTSDNMLMRIFRSLRRAATLSGRLERLAALRTQPPPALSEGPTISADTNPRHPVSRTHLPSDTMSSGLRFWTQYSGPEGDILHIRNPQLERMDPAVQERLVRIRSSGSMNIVQDGVMTEDLARDLLHLHLHQQHQDLQLRQHQARLRVRFHNQNTLGQVQRDLSRRLARCSLCGGSVYISSHVLLRVSTPDPPPAHSTPAPSTPGLPTLAHLPPGVLSPVQSASGASTTAHSTPVHSSSGAPSPTQSAPGASPSVRSTTANFTGTTRSSGPSPRRWATSSRFPPPAYARASTFSSSSSTSTSALPWPPVSVPSSPPSGPVPTVQSRRVASLHEPLQYGPEPAHPPLQPPLMQSNPSPVNRNSQSSSPRVLSPSQLSPPSPPSPTPSSLAFYAPSSPSSPPSPPPPPSIPLPSIPASSVPPPSNPPSSTPPSPPSRRSAPNAFVPPPHGYPWTAWGPILAQVWPRHFANETAPNAIGLFRPHGDNASPSSLIWEVPASQNRHNVQQPSNANFRNPPSSEQNRQSQEQQSTLPDQLVTPDEEDLRVPSSVLVSQTVTLPTDSPSTSTHGTLMGSEQNGDTALQSALIDSSDSETEVLVEHCRRREPPKHTLDSKHGRVFDLNKPSSSTAENKPCNDLKAESGLGHQSPLYGSHSSDGTDNCNRGQSVKRKGSTDSPGTSAKVKPPSKSTSNSDSDSAMEETNQQTGMRKKGLKRCRNSESRHKNSETNHAAPVSEMIDPDQSGNTSSQQEGNSTSQASSPLEQLPEPTFTRQLEAITGRLDHLMFLQRNALDPALRERSATVQDNSPLGNTDSSNASQENNGPSDAISITSRLLIRLTESLSRQIEMVQQICGHQGSCTEHQTSRNSGEPANFTVLNNTRRRGQELLSLMADSLSTFSSHNGLSEDLSSNRNPVLNQVQTMSAAFWLLQGLYILLHLALELTDVLLTHFVSSYEPSDPDDSSGAPIPQPCVCLNSNAPPTPLLSRLPFAPSLWNGVGGQAGSPRPIGPLMMHSVYDAVRSHTQSPRPTFLSNGNTTPQINNESSSPGAYRQWYLNLHNVLDSARSPNRHSLPVDPPSRQPRNVSNDSSGLPNPVQSVPINTAQENNEEPPADSRWLPPTSSFALVHPIVSSGTIRRNYSYSPRSVLPALPSRQHVIQQQQAFGYNGPGVYNRPGFMRLRSRLLHPPLLHQQDRPSFAPEADMAAQQSLYFHFDSARNIGHFVREPNFTIEEHRIHRIQLWDFSKGDIPDITRGDENLVVAECKIHNDASVDISADGRLLVALLPAHRPPAAHSSIFAEPPGQTVGVYSLVWESLGQLLYTTSLDQPAVSVALSPTASYLLVGLTTRRAMLMRSDQHALAQIFKLEGAKPGRPVGARGRFNFKRNIEAHSDHVSVGINCIRWAPVSGQGIVYGTNTGALVMLR